jgi:hypothetical protein
MSALGHLRRIPRGLSGRLTSALPRKRRTGPARSVAFSRLAPPLAPLTAPGSESACPQLVMAGPGWPGLTRPHARPFRRDTLQLSHGRAGWPRKGGHDAMVRKPISCRRASSAQAAVSSARPDGHCARSTLDRSPERFPPKPRPASHRGSFVCAA